MADAMQELDSSIMLAMGAINRLKVKNPKHELLQWDEKPFFMGPLPESFWERFGDKHLSEGNKGINFEMTEVYLNYYKALTEVLGEHY